ncbi:MAG TPA: hypothetical protein VGH28_18955 [Polyangiaceae bacterium]|jgi:hypothetical protein
MRAALALSILACGCGGGAPSEPDADVPDAAPDVAAEIDAAVDAAVDVSDGPDIDSIPWSTGDDVGYGVAFKDTGNPGDAMFIGYGGYGAKLIPTQLWVTALFRATLRARGVRWVWAVQGPADPDYAGDEIGNSKIAAAMIPLVSAQTSVVIVAAHSSGAFVAQELLEQLAGGADPNDVTKNLLVYFALDGGGGVSQAAIDRTRNAYFVSSHDGATQSANYDAMTSLASEFASKGGFYDNDASGSGCDAAAEWCVHDTLINTKPHDPTDLDVPDDYSDFAGRPVCTSYLDAKL